MTLWDGYDDVPFTVVRNDVGQYSVWPASRPRPGGWHAVGDPATEEACLDEVARRWANASPPGSAAIGAHPARGLAGPVRQRPDVPVHLLIERADVPPDAIAMRCGTETLTRAELFRRARACAGVLAEEGCGREVPVAVLLPRGGDALVAILAVLFANGAYVPLHRDDPPARLAAVLADCGRPMVLVDDDTAPRLGRYTGRVLTLAELYARARSAPPPRPLPPVPAGALAYVIYTSGTTGEPKGVEGTHGQLVNYALWCRANFRHRAGEWHVLHAPLSFLGSLTNIFTPLLAGWPIRIVPEGATIDDLVALLDTTPVGLLKLTPTHVRMLLARGAGERRTARQFMIGSEPLVMTDEVAAWVAHDPEAIHVNHYGLTETHGCFCHWFGAEVPVGEGVPIGRPIDNVRAHIVDRDGVEVARGQSGELLVGGSSIGRGYRGRPRLTARRWVPDWFGGGGGRLLRTGDLARQRADGNVEILGRADRQVKIRGNRVEPRAVENALRAHADVVEALVLPRLHHDATTLVAYVVPRVGAVLDPVAIHRELAGVFPPPSVPSRIAVLAEFPVNANGKVDVAALPEPAPPAPPAEVSPSVSEWTRYDRVVATAFASSLGVDSVGLHDDFFELGGDSLMAVHVAVAVGERLGAEAPVPTADCGTVRAYAERAARAHADHGEGE